MLKRVLQRMIERGQTEGIQDKLNFFWAANAITKEEFDELTALLESKL